MASGTPNLTWTASTDIGSGIARYDVYMDKVLLGSTDAGTLSFTPAALGPGAHTWYVRAYDVCNLLRDSNKAFTFAVGDATCVAGASEPCAGSAVGLCRPGTRTRLSLGEWGACVGQVLPSAEICNDQNDDCDGQVDEELGTCGVQPGLDAGSVPVPADALPSGDASAQDRLAADTGGSTTPVDAPITTADAASTPGPADASSIIRPTPDSASIPWPADASSISGPTLDAAKIPQPADALATLPPTVDAASNPAAVDAVGKTAPGGDAGVGFGSPDASSRVVPVTARKPGGCSVSTSGNLDWRSFCVLALLLLARRRRR